MSKALILGGGISGLTTCYQLAKRKPNLKILLVDNSDRLGGWINSKKVGNNIFELGPRSLRPNGIQGIGTLSLIDELGLSDKILKVGKSEPASKNRYLYYQDKLHKLPNSLTSLLSNSPVLKGVVRGILKEPFINSKAGEDESIDSFMTRRFGPDLAEKLISAMVHGIYAGDSKDLSIRSCFKSIYESEKENGSIVKGIIKDMLFNKDKELELALNKLSLINKDLLNLYQNCSMYSFEGGIEQLSLALIKKLKLNKNVTILTNQDVKQLNFNEDSVDTLINTELMKFDHVISAIPSTSLQSILPNQHSELSYNPGIDVAVINIAYNSKNVLPIEAFGYLIPRNNPNPTLGVVFDSCPFPSSYPNHQSLTVMMGGHQFYKIGPNPTKELIQSIALKTLKEHLNITEIPSHINVSIHRNCIPQYRPNHVNRMQSLRHQIQINYYNRLSLTGASYNGVSINDCIHYSKLLADSLTMVGPLSSLKRNEMVTGLDHHV